jgi:hypothetical protein
MRSTRPSGRTQNVTSTWRPRSDLGVCPKGQRAGAPHRWGHAAARPSRPGPGTRARTSAGAPARASSGAPTGALSCSRTRIAARTRIARGGGRGRRRSGIGNRLRLHDGRRNRGVTTAGFSSGTDHRRRFGWRRRKYKDHPWTPAIAATTSASPTAAATLPARVAGRRHGLPQRLTGPDGEQHQQQVRRHRKRHARGAAAPIGGGAMLKVRFGGFVTRGRVGLVGERGRKVHAGPHMVRTRATAPAMPTGSAIRFLRREADDLDARPFGDVHRLDHVLVDPVAARP